MNNLLVWLLQFILPRRYWYRRLYLRSAHWQQMKREYKFSRCNGCGHDWGLDLHHKKYYDDNGSILWRENYKHFETLCRECHKLEHRKG